MVKGRTGKGVEGLQDSSYSTELSLHRSKDISNMDDEWEHDRSGDQ